MASIEDFHALDLRVGTIVGATEFPDAHKPAYRLVIDLGSELGLKQSSARITERYEPHELIGRQVVAVVNLGSRWIAGYQSEVLVLGAVPEEGDVVLLAPDDAVPNGARIA